MAVPNADLRAGVDPTALPSFAIVCDSSCDLDPALCQKLGITLVSHRVMLSDIELLDRSISNDDIGEMLVTDVRMRSSSPGVGSFVSALEALVERGYSDIVIVCPSRKILGTYEAAKQAASELEGTQVHLLDCACISGQLALVILGLALDREKGVPLQIALEQATNRAQNSCMWMLLPPTVDLVESHVLGKARGIRRSFKSLSLRVSGGWLMTTMDAQGEVTLLQQSSDLAHLAGVLARKISLYAQEVGALTVLELTSTDKQALAELRRPLDTNEFEKWVVDTLMLRPSTLTVMGVGAVGIAAVPQDLLSPAELSKLLQG